MTLQVQVRTLLVLDVDETLIMRVSLDLSRMTIPRLVDENVMLSLIILGWLLNLANPIPLMKYPVKWELNLSLSLPISQVTTMPLSIEEAVLRLLVLLLASEVQWGLAVKA